MLLAVELYKIDRFAPLNHNSTYILVEGMRRRCKGGGPLFVDFLLEAFGGDDANATSRGMGSDADDESISIDSKQRRRAIEEYLSLIGDYGLIQTDSSFVSKKWQIQKSTHPWREGGDLFQAGDITWSSILGEEVNDKMLLSWRSMGEWRIFESSLDICGLELLFDIPSTRLRNYSSHTMSKL
jgi:hypothetical protein